MYLGDEFNDFIVNGLIDSSSLDDEDNFYYDAANIVSEALLNEPIHRGFIIGRRTVDRKRLSWHDLLYLDYFSDNPIFGPEFFRRRLVYSINLIMLHTCVLL
jgi:hypothetical protein